jgi:DNA-binding NtrC family response regulator
MTGGPAAILVVDEDASSAQLCLGALRPLEAKTEHVATLAEAYARLVARRFDVVVVDLGNGGTEASPVLGWIRARDDGVAVLVVGADATRIAVEAMRGGASTYVPKTTGYLDELVAAAAAALARPLPRPNASPALPSGAIIGTSPAIVRVRQLIRLYARSDEPVLILGESGVGKELVASALHHASPRAARPLRVLNCPAVPATLFEAELFGAVRGTWTGLDRDRDGLLKAADGGTVFLDEVADLPLETQAKLLRLLDQRTYTRLGSPVELATDVRFVAATNGDLFQMVEAGRFRRDLLFRLGVLCIEIPPLRDRISDVPLLAEHFLRKLAGGEHPTMSRALIAQLMSRPWRGNVRELESVMKRAVLAWSASGTLQLGDGTPWSTDGSRGDTHKDKLIQALIANNGRLGPTARELGVATRTVQRHLKRYGVDPRPFRDCGRA